MPVILIPRSRFRRSGTPRRLFTRGIDTCPAGPYGPTILANDAGAGTIAWTNPGNTQLSDDVYATAVTVAQDTQRLNATGFNFQIDPAGQINGITVEVEAKVLVGSETVYVRAIKGGVVSSTRTSGTWSSTEGLVVYGSSANLLGETWTPAQVNAPDFGVSIRVEDALTNTFSCDFVQVTIACSVVGRTTKNTRSAPLGELVGMGWRGHG